MALTREGGEWPYVDQLRREAAAFFDKSSWLYGSHVEILGTGSDSTTRYRTRHFVRSRPALKAVAKRVLRR
ncbi:MAG TPA: hypothetical protein VGR26_05525 [Acidimicrobiales bacterium]|nr:hypothetical protein [Acidimicrobiales bacterium]